MAAATTCCAPNYGRRAFPSPRLTIRLSQNTHSRQGGKFNLVTCFETLEHMPDPLAGIGVIAANLAEPGLVLFSTLLQPPDLDKLGLNWRYVGPRNGHVSLFSRNALVLAWRGHGCQTASFNDNLHVAFRTMPEFAKHLIK